MAELEDDLSERHPFAVGHLAVGELGFGNRGVADLGPGGGGEFQVPGEEVGVEVGLDHHLDGEASGLGIGEVLGDVALWVDDDRPAGGLVTDEVGGVGEALEVVLLEFHRNSFVVYL